MRAVLAIAAKDLRLRLRDRSALVLGFVAPILIAALMAMAFRTADRYHAELGFVSHDRGPLTTALQTMLRGPDLKDIVTIHQYADDAAARRAVDKGTVGAAIVVPAGFSTVMHGAAGTDLQVLSSSANNLDSQVAASIADSFVAQANADRLSVAARIAAGAPSSQAESLMTEAGSLRLPASLATTSPGGHRLTTISYYAPGMGIFFVLFAIGIGARGWYAEQAAGTLDRVAAAPISGATMRLASGITTFVYALASLVTMVAVSSWAFGASWGSTGAVLLLCVALGLSVVALSAFVTAVARTDRQADGLSSVITFVLALVGGNFVFLSVEPTVLRVLALGTPNGWAMRAFTDMSTGSGPSAALRPLGGILAFTAVVTVLVVLLDRRRASA